MNMLGQEKPQRGADTNWEDYGKKPFNSIPKPLREKNYVPKNRHSEQIV